jgi:hypothetical protein
MSSSSNVGSARFRNVPQFQNGQELILPSTVGGNMAARTRKLSSKQMSPRRTLDGGATNQSFSLQNSQGRENSSKLGKEQPRRGTAGSVTNTPTTINNNNIVININKNYNNPNNL